MNGGLKKDVKEKRSLNAFLFTKNDQMSRVGSRDGRTGWRSKIIG